MGFCVSKICRYLRKGHLHKLPPIGQLALDVAETDEAIVVVAPLAGMTIRDIDIKLEKRTLTIQGERKKPSSTIFPTYVAAECFWGKFKRSILLPSDVQTDKIRASFKNGILQVVIPKVMVVSERQIEVT